MIVNVPLLRNPLNWIIVFLMLLIAAFAGHFALRFIGAECPHDSQSSNTTTLPEEA